MSTFVLFVLLGLGSGALIAGIALSVVITFRGSGTINLAAGSVSVLTAFVYFGLRTGGYLWIPLPFMPSRVQLGGPWPALPAFLVAMVVCAGIGCILEFLVVRPLRRAAPLAKLVATLGVLLTVQAIILLRFGSSGQIAPAVLPASFVNVFGVGVPEDRLLLTGLIAMATALLVFLYRRTRFGFSTRAAAENETTARYAGLSPARLSLASTVLASLIAGALGILVAPLTQLDPTTIPLAVVPALGAALLARFTSFGIAAVAGLGMGVIQSLLTYLQTMSWFPSVGGTQLPGVADLVYFLIIVAAMYFRGGGLPERGAPVEKRLPAVPAAGPRLRPVTIASVVLAVACMTLPYDFRQALINTLIGSVICLSLVVVTGFVGQMSIAQVALAGAAGFVVQKLATEAGIGFPFGPILGILVALIFGVITAISALRVRGVNLAIVTLAAAVAIQNFGFENSVWGAGVSGSPVPSPRLFSVDLGPGGSVPFGDYGAPSPIFALLCGAVLVILGLLVTGLRRSGLGMRMLAVRSNERAAAAAGISVRAVKMTAFAVAAAIAGVAGCLYAYGFGSVSSDRFGLVIALTFVAFAYVGGITTVTGAVLGGLGVSEGLIVHALNKWFGIPVGYQLLVGGLLLVLTLARKPEGLAGVRPDTKAAVRSDVEAPRPVSPTMPTDDGFSAGWGSGPQTVDAGNSMGGHR